MATFSGDVQYSQNGTVTNPWLGVKPWKSQPIFIHFPWTFGHVESNFATEGRCASVVNGLLDRGVDPTPPKYIQIFNIPWKPWDPWVGIGSWSVHFGDHIFGERILAARHHGRMINSELSLLAKTVSRQTVFSMDWFKGKVYRKPSIFPWRSWGLHQ